MLSFKKTITQTLSVKAICEWYSFNLSLKLLNLREPPLEAAWPAGGSEGPLRWKLHGKQWLLCTVINATSLLHECFQLRNSEPWRECFIEFCIL